MKCDNNKKLSTNFDIKLVNPSKNKKPWFLP